MHVCGACGSGLVQADGWTEGGSPGLWRVKLRCPDCAERSEGVYGQDEIDCFDEELDRGTRELIHLLESFERNNMEETLRRFQVALEADLILPEDF